MGRAGRLVHVESRVRPVNRGPGEPRGLPVRPVRREFRENQELLDQLDLVEYRENKVCKICSV